MAQASSRCIRVARADPPRQRSTNYSLTQSTMRAECVCAVFVKFRSSELYIVGGVKTLVAVWNLEVELGGATYVLQTVLMTYPSQASSLQGSRNVSSDILAVDDLGTGSDWQQSKLNQALLALVGE